MLSVAQRHFQNARERPFTVETTERFDSSPVVRADTLVTKM